MISIVSWQCCHWDDANVDLAPVVPFLGQVVGFDNQIESLGRSACPFPKIWTRYRWVRRLVGDWFVSVQMVIRGLNGLSCFLILTLLLCGHLSSQFLILPSVVDWVKYGVPCCDRSSLTDGTSSASTYPHAPDQGEDQVGSHEC